MLDQKQNAAELKLRKLAVDLKKAYGRAARHIATQLKPIEVALEEIGEPWKPQHYAEMVQEKGSKGVARPLTSFAREASMNGTEVEYMLCVGRNPEMKCALFVSACKYQIKTAEGADDGKPPEVTIKNMAVVPPSSLPVPLRIKILDVMDDFSAAYEQHVRDSRKSLLSDWAGDSEQDPEPTPIPPEAARDEQQHEEEKPKGKVKLFSPEDMNTPVEQWIPALIGKR